MAGEARHGGARHGEVWQVWWGKAGSGLVRQVRHGEVRQGVAGCGLVGCGR